MNDQIEKKLNRVLDNALLTQSIKERLRAANTDRSDFEKRLINTPVSGRPPSAGDWGNEESLEIPLGHGLLTIGKGKSLATRNLRLEINDAGIPILVARVPGTEFGVPIWSPAISAYEDNVRFMLEKHQRNTDEEKNSFFTSRNWTGSVEIPTQIPNGIITGITGMKCEKIEFYNSQQSCAGVSFILAPHLQTKPRQRRPGQKPIVEYPRIITEDKHGRMSDDEFFARTLMVTASVAVSAAIIGLTAKFMGPVYLAELKMMGIELLEDMAVDAAEELVVSWIEGLVTKLVEQEIKGLEQDESVQELLITLQQVYNAVEKARKQLESDHQLRRQFEFCMDNPEHLLTQMLSYFIDAIHDYSSQELANYLKQYEAFNQVDKEIVKKELANMADDPSRIADFAVYSAVHAAGTTPEEVIAVFDAVNDIVYGKDLDQVLRGIHRASTVIGPELQEYLDSAGVLIDLAKMELTPEQLLKAVTDDLEGFKQALIESVLGSLEQKDLEIFESAVSLIEMSWEERKRNLFKFALTTLAGPDGEKLFNKIMEAKTPHEALFGVLDSILEMQFRTSFKDIEKSFNQIREDLKKIRQASTWDVTEYFADASTEVLLTKEEKQEGLFYYEKGKIFAELVIDLKKHKNEPITSKIIIVAKHMSKIFDQDSDEMKMLFDKFKGAVEAVDGISFVWDTVSNKKWQNIGILNTMGSLCALGYTMSSKELGFEPVKTQDVETVLWPLLNELWDSSRSFDLLFNGTDQGAGTAMADQTTTNAAIVMTADGDFKIVNKDNDTVLMASNTAGCTIPKTRENEEIEVTIKGKPVKAKQICRSFDEAITIMDGNRVPNKQFSFLVFDMAENELFLDGEDYNHGRTRDKGILLSTSTSGLGLMPNGDVGLSFQDRHNRGIRVPLNNIGSQKTEANVIIDGSVGIQEIVNAPHIFPGGGTSIKPRKENGIVAMWLRFRDTGDLEIVKREYYIDLDEKHQTLATKIGIPKFLKDFNYQGPYKFVLSSYYVAVLDANGNFAYLYPFTANGILNP